MSTTITWQCTECGKQDKHPGDDDLTLEDIDGSRSNTMCSECHATCYPISVE